MKIKGILGKNKKNKKAIVETLDLEAATDRLIEEYDIAEAKVNLVEENIFNKKQKNKKWIIGILSFVFLSFLYGGIKDYITKVRDISFYSDTDEVLLGSNIDLHYEISPKNAVFEDSDIEILFDNENLLRKNGNDFVAEKEGTVKAYIRYNDRNYDVKTFLLIPVKAKDLLVNDVTVGLNYSTYVDVELIPTNTTNKTVELITDNNELIKIEDQRIYGLSEGVAKVTAVSADGVKKDFNVEVQKIEPESVFIRFLDDTYVVGTEDVLKVDYEPKLISEPHITWTSSDPSVASIDSDGNLSLKSAGVATITALYSDDVKESKEITVKYPQANSIKVNTNYNKLYSGNSTQLWVTFDPSKVDNNDVSWNSSNEKVVKVDSNGLITAVAIGKATITAKTNNGKTSSVEIECIEKPVQNIHVADVGNSSANSNTISRSSSSTNSSSGGTTYVLNTNTKKFHYSYCSSVGQMKDSNKSYSSESRETIISWGYSPCKRCYP